MVSFGGSSVTRYTGNSMPMLFFLEAVFRTYVMLLPFKTSLSIQLKVDKMMLKTTFKHGNDYLEQWFSTFLKVQPFNTVPHVVMTPNHQIISVLLHKYNFATIMNCYIDIWYVGYLIYDPKRVATHRLRITDLETPLWVVQPFRVGSSSPRANK